MKARVTGPLGRRRAAAAVAAVTLLGFGARTWQLAARPLWFDEAMEYWVATAGPGALLPTVQEALQDPPLFSALLHAWMGIGREEFTLRTFPLLTSVLAIPLLYVLVAKVSGRRAGLIAAIILALLPPQIRFAQEVGQYALLVTLLILNLIALVEARQSGRLRFWLAWAATGALSIANFYGSLITVAAVAGATLAAAAWRRERRLLITQASMLLLLFLLVSPLLVGWIPQQLFRGPTREAFNLAAGSPGFELSAFYNLTKSLLAFQLTGYIPQPERWMGLIAAAAALMAAAVALAFVGRLGRREPLTWLLAAMAAYYLAGRVGAYPYGGTRHSLILLPLLLAAAAMGIDRAWRAAPALGALLLLAFVGLSLAMPRESQEDLRTVARAWLAREDRRPPTYVYYGAAPGFGYQLQVMGAQEGTLPPTWYLNCWAGKPEHYCGREGIYYGRWIRNLSPEEKLAEIRQTVGTESGRFWLVFSHAGEHERGPLMAVVRESFTIVEAIEAEEASAFLLDGGRE